jgi:hypothetical protein
MPAATDDYPYLSGQSWLSSATHAASVTPSDTTDLSDVTRWLYVGGSGNIVVNMADGTTVTLLGIAAGSLLPIRVSRVKSTNTTATGIVALW